MTTHNHANHTPRTTGHPSMEVLTVAEADAIVGGGFIGDPNDLRYKYGRTVVKWLDDHDVGKKVVNAAKRVVDWIGDLF